MGRDSEQDVEERRRAWDEGRFADASSGVLHPNRCKCGEVYLSRNEALYARGGMVHRTEACGEEPGWTASRSPARRKEDVQPL